MRRSSVEIVAEIPHQGSRKAFYDLLASGWGIARQDPVTGMESLGIGFLWLSRLSDRGRARMPHPWSLIRAGLEERGFLSPSAHVYFLRSEVQRITGQEQPRLILSLERP